MNTADTDMGKDLDDLYNILNSDAKEELQDSRVIIEHRWNHKKAAFEKWDPQSLSGQLQQKRGFILLKYLCLIFHL